MDLHYLFTEPSGIVIPFELRNSILVAGRDVPAEQGLIVLVIDATDPDWPFGDELGHITKQQIEQSDLVVVSKIDTADPTAVEVLLGRVREIAAERDVLQVSLHSGEGVEGLLDAVLSV
jgi:G3E family GTPase